MSLLKNRVFDSIYIKITIICFNNEKLQIDK